MESYDVNIEPTFIERVTRITEENLTNEQFGVEDLATAMGMSYPTLYRQLKNSSHKTISQFVREVRLEKANDLLLHEDITASEVAYRVGFGSPTYFSKCFRKYFGYAPGEFRKRKLLKNNREKNSLTIQKRIHKVIIVFLALFFITFLSILFLGNNHHTPRHETTINNKPAFTND